MKLADTERQKSPDGKMSVRGYFTSEQKDAVGDIITRSATERAIEDYKQWGNIRYMHQPRPVGRVQRIGSSDGLEWNEVEFTVTKPDVVDDIDNGLLSALSVGILVDWGDIDPLEDGGWVINNYKLAEISLVDHPANYDARLKSMSGEDALQYVKGLYSVDNTLSMSGTSSTNDLVYRHNPKKSETDAMETDKEKSPACREEDETKEDCVSRKIPELIDEGMDQDQAVAAANEICSESCADKSLMEEKSMDKDLETKEVDAVEVVVDEELTEDTVTTDETSTEKAIDTENEEISEDEIVEEEKNIDGEEIVQAVDTNEPIVQEVFEDDDEEVEEPVEESKDIISDVETIVEDETPEWAKKLAESVDALTNVIKTFVETPEISAEAEIEQDTNGESTDVEKTFDADTNTAVEPDIQKGAMPATELIETKDELETEPSQKAKTLRDVLMEKFQVK